MTELSATMGARVRDLVGPKVEAFERRLVQELESAPPVLAQAAGNVLESGGKRLRPYLHLLSAELCGYRGEADVAFATALEYVHVASLLHDDVIDEAVLRRGNPTLNQRFGDTLTVLVGDYLCVKAQAIAVEHGDLDLVSLILQTTLDLVTGEALQERAKKRLDVGEAEYLEIVELKTGRLMAAACESAARLAGHATGSEACRQMRSYGRALGLAFQLTDDILDFESDEDTLGKPVLSDLREGTLTLPAIHALEKGGAEARRLIAAVVEDGGFGRVPAAEVQALVRDSGGIEAARTRARAAAQEAARALEGFPEGLSKGALVFATDFAVGRAF